MIREHVFNSQWWGGRAGIIESFDFFDAPAGEQQRALDAFDWVELRAPLRDAPLRAIHERGFFQIDVQVPFRIALARVPDAPSLAGFTVERAPFTIDEHELAPFANERYRYLPGVTEEKLAARYSMYTQHLLASDPEWCLRIVSGGRVQGWFLSQNTPDGLALELAMLHRDATTSGIYIYQKALRVYAERARLGFARFSITNVPVLNIYSRLGAQYLAPVGSWLWIR